MLQKKSKERDELDKGLPLLSVANLLDEHGILISSVFFLNCLRTIVKILVFSIILKYYSLNAH